MKIGKKKYFRSGCLTLKRFPLSLNTHEESKILNGLLKNKKNVSSDEKLINELKANLGVFWMIIVFFVLKSALEIQHYRILAGIQFY